MNIKQSYLFKFSFINKLSAEKGPSILIFKSFNFFTTGIIDFISSLPISPFSPACGLNPDIIIFGLLILKSTFKV